MICMLIKFAKPLTLLLLIVSLGGFALTSILVIFLISNPMVTLSGGPQVVVQAREIPFARPLLILEVVFFLNSAVFSCVFAKLRKSSKEQIQNAAEP